MTILPNLSTPAFLRGSNRRLWVDPANPGRHLNDAEEKRRQIYSTVDRAGFDWQVFLVAASGFFTDSYNLFATNVILPSIAFVYWPRSIHDPYHRNEIAINEVTLAGSAIGQLLFGYLADRYGRRKLYGIELILVIVSTLGLTQASSGYQMDRFSSSSMSALGWILFYRLLQGVGIGAEYPISAVITAEFAPVRSRARMMAAVFLMQPLGQLLAAGVGLCVAVGYNKWALLEQDPVNEASLLRQVVAVDSIWRWVIGVGTIPAVVAILFRLTIPESPRHTLDANEDAVRAFSDAHMFYTSRHSLNMAEAADLGLRDVHHETMSVGSFRPGNSISFRTSADMSYNSSLHEAATQTKPPFWKGLRDYLTTDGNWRWLAGTSLCWFLLDFAYFGLGINNPRTLAKIWAAQIQPAALDMAWNTGLVNGKTILTGDHNNIYLVLKNSAFRSMITSSIGSVLGCLVLIKIIPYISRRIMLYWTFVFLFVLLLLTGVTLFVVFETDRNILTITFYVLIQFVFNLGPNTLLFVIPAEIFPTRYRATCYGISAASGKIGSVIVQSFLPYVYNHSIGLGSFNDRTGLAIVLIVFSCVMLAGAGVAWLWIPDVQKGREAGNGYDLPSKTLEELALGRAANFSRSRKGTKSCFASSA